jgi:hypothetical protein
VARYRFATPLGFRRGERHEFEAEKK